MKKYDVGIVGETLLAPFLAGQLAHVHGKKICLFLSGAVQHRIRREINFSFDLITRPESWEMLNQAREEALPIIANIGGAQAVGKVPALILSHTPAGADMLSHMYHYLHGMDYQIERLAEADFPHAIAAYRARAVRIVRPDAFWPAILEWLAKLGVDMIEPEELTIKPRKEGAAQIKTTKAICDVGQIVLADDRSIHQYGAVSVIERFFVPVKTTALLLQPGPEKIEQIIISPEFDFCAQTDRQGHIKCLANTSISNMSNLLNHNITGDISNKNTPHFHLAGRADFTKLIPRDGAPVIGKLARSNLWGIAGLGHGDVFFAPMLARLIEGKPLAREASYLGARSADAKRQSTLIQDRIDSKPGHSDE